MEKNNLNNKLASMLSKANELVNGFDGMMEGYKKGLTTIKDPELRDWITSKMKEAKASNPGDFDVKSFTVEFHKRAQDYKDKQDKENK